MWILKTVPDVVWDRRSAGTERAGTGPTEGRTA